MNKGFTLIEIIVAIAIFVVGILSMVSMFSLGNKMAYLSKERTCALALAQEKIEEIFSKKYEDIISESKDLLSDPFSLYERKVEVSFVDQNLQEIQEDIGLKKVQVSIFWKDKSLDLNTLISKH